MNCEFCQREFTKEKSWFNHSCEKKRRWMDRESFTGRLAFQAWERFHELSGSTKTKKITQLDFIQSHYYSAFNKFAHHIKEINAISPRKFIDYVIKNNIPVDKWCNESLYDIYVKDLLSNETSDQAIIRTIEWLKQWSESTGNEWIDFFRIINPMVGTTILCQGQISPWIFYNSKSAGDFFELCSPEQHQMINRWAPVHIWKLKFKNNQNDAEYIRNLLQQSGI